MIVVIALLFYIFQSNAMESNPLIKITSEKDIAKFASTLVAFTSMKDNFNPWGIGNPKYYTFDHTSEEITNYGYLEDKGFGSRCKQKYAMLPYGVDQYADGLLYDFDDVYVVHRLYKIHHCENNHKMFHTCFQCDINRIRNDCEAVSTILRPGHFDSQCYMRNIRQQEAISILDALRNNKAQFSWWFEKKWTTPTILALLEVIKSAS
jgi:hypothetical protein